ncbi:hypothetical protein GLW08_16815 [Pontibacillus yanchengensis]|uniref:Uncharacterized protein n=2 Tax=Pontibacillus yanchengensis TaxID=462910 RepID=A0ACC7VJ55_9BACI|nr:hypothetical protein [Pontibacillus yanchengensis]MYL32603.1 hypothetical protein [Pontibacillus yanchengensis]MYL54998.1 hypothetical protein [Pontibacillus yanchengensis]
MEHRISYDNMDDILNKLEDDYIQELVQNDTTTVEDFIDHYGNKGSGSETGMKHGVVMLMVELS